MLLDDSKYFASTYDDLHTGAELGCSKNRTLVKSARCFMMQFGLPPSFLGEAVSTANQVHQKSMSNEELQRDEPVRNVEWSNANG